MTSISLVRAAESGGQGAGNQVDVPVVTILPKPGEKPISIETENLDKVGEAIGKRIDGIAHRVSRKPAMRWMDQEVAPGITWLKLITCLGLLLSVLIVERALARWLHSALGRAGSKWVDPNLASVSLKKLSKPISLLIWVYGSYLALSPLYVHFQRAVGVNPVHTAMRKFAEVGGILAIVWLLYVLFHLGDDCFRNGHAVSGRSVGGLWSHCRKPFRLLFVLILMRIPLPVLEGFPILYSPILNGLSVLLIASVAWLTISALSAGEEMLLSHYSIDREDNLSARTVQTQVRFARKLLASVVIVVTVASILMLSEKVRQLGTGILTSAGILGIVVGLAAQRSIANLLVGLQIAVTQPVRIDDVVVIEKEWGRIEEITSTYVAVRLWDLRRLMVPLSYFIEKPFQNWTRTSAEIIGTVYLHTDYLVNVEVLRQELLKILHQSTLWNGRVCALQVTDARKDGLELRALMSASDASKAWDLRCEVREKLVLFLQENCPSSLPRVRVEMETSQQERSQKGAPGVSPVPRISLIIPS